MSLATSVSTDTFDQEVLQSQTPVLVDFWAPWCGPCLRVAPEIDAVADELQGRLKVVKVNVDENPEVASQYGVQGIPNLMIFKGGRPVDRVVGAVPSRLIKEAVNRHL